MKNTKGYIEHPGRVVDAGGKFEHVMAISLDPRTGYKEGVIRCVKSREGDVATAGFIDRSALYKVNVGGNSPEYFSIRGELVIKDQDAIIGRLGARSSDFLGLEDPDVWIDEQAGLLHLYFTMPFRAAAQDGLLIHLGHAVGNDLDSLRMTMPVLMDEGIGGAKELSVAPMNRQGFRYNLIESSDLANGEWYSTVRVAIARDMGGSWEFGETVFHPAEHHIPWIAGHASPGPLLPKTFMDVGEGKMLGIMNGREANRKVGGITHYGIFSVGLFIYDYERGKIDWVSPEPFIRDSNAKTITFASQFVEQEKGNGILYAHVDDSFVRAYTLNAAEMKSLLSEVL
jgi:hypothetical protein